MTQQKHAIFAAALVAAALVAPPAQAQDKVTVAVGQINNWENQAPTLGQEFFKKHGLTLETVATAGAGETIQAVISGSADIGIGAGIAGVMRAFSRGAPVRILAPSFTGTGDLYWYVKADSPLKSLKDVTEKNTIAYSTNGSSSHNIVTAFIEELGAKGKPVATGTPAATITGVMSGQIDVGWAAPPFGRQEIKDGKIRILARGSDVPSLRSQTVRATIVNADMLKSRRDAAVRFVQAYREAVDWMYSDPKALEAYAKKVDRSLDLIKDTVAEFYPKSAMQSETMADMDGIIRDAVKLKYLDAPLTKEQISELVQTPPKQ